MELSPIEFFRAFAVGRVPMICSEPVVAWAESLGFVGPSADEQRALWESRGAEEGAAIIAERMGLRRISAEEVEPGDAVIIGGGGQGRVLGVNAGRFSVAATNGRVHVGQFSILSGWSLRHDLACDRIAAAS